MKEKTMLCCCCCCSFKLNMDSFLRPIFMRINVSLCIVLLRKLINWERKSNFKLYEVFFKPLESASCTWNIPFVQHVCA